LLKSRRNAGAENIKSYIVKKGREELRGILIPCTKGPKTGIFFSTSRTFSG
jgi:hypothetical protein